MQTYEFVQLDLATILATVGNTVLWGMIIFLVVNYIKKSKAKKKAEKGRE